MTTPKGWEETEPAMSELEKRAFDEVMADVSMPDDSGPDYDSWLFHKAWQAAEVHEPQGLRREVQELLPLLLNGIMPNKEALHDLRDLAYAPPAQEDKPVAWHYKSSRGQCVSLGRDTSVYRDSDEVETPLYTRPQSDELRKAVEKAEVSLETLFHVMNHTEVEPEIIAKNIAATIDQLRSARQK